jgi:hypothetical protein
MLMQAGMGVLTRDGFDFRQPLLVGIEPMSQQFHWPAAISL